MSFLKDVKKNKAKMEKALGVSKPAPKKPAAAPATKKPEPIIKRGKLTKFNKDLYVQNGTDYELEMGDDRYVLTYGEDILGQLPATWNSFIDKHDDGQSLTVDALIDGTVIAIYEEID